MSSAATNEAMPDFDACGHRAAQFLLGDLCSGHRLHHIGTGDEHVRGLVDHEHEIGHGRAVDRAAGARAHDHADLGRHARGLDVAIEDPAVAGEADRSFLDAGTGAVVEPDQRGADLERKVHQLVDLLGEDLAERTAEQREVLGEHEDLAAVDRAPPGDHTVGVRPLVGRRDSRLRASRSSSRNEPSSSRYMMRSRASILPRSCWRWTDRSDSGLERLLAALVQVREPLAEGVFGHG